MAGERSSHWQRFISFLKGESNHASQDATDRPHSWIIHFSTSQYRKYSSHSKRGDKAKVFFWNAPDPLGYDVFRELTHFAVQAYIGRDLVALCDLLFWPENTIENFYENRERWNELCGVEMMNFETDLYLAREQGIQFETTGGRLKYLEIQITGDIDPQNLLRRIFSNELTPYEGRRLLNETAEIKNYCEIVASTTSRSATDGGRLVSEMGDSKPHDQNREIYVISDTSESKKSTPSTNENDEFKTVANIGGNARCNEDRWNDVLSNNMKGSYSTLARSSDNDQNKDQMYGLSENTEGPDVKNSDLCLQVKSFDNSSEQGTTASKFKGLENCRTITINDHNINNVGRSDSKPGSYSHPDDLESKHLGDKKVGNDNEVQKNTGMAHFCSYCGKECFSTLKHSSNAQLVTAQDAEHVSSVEEKRSTENSATAENTNKDSVGNKDSDSLSSMEYGSDDEAFQSCEEGSDGGNTDNLTCHSAEIAKSKYSHGCEDKTVLDGDDVSDDTDDQHDLNKTEDGHTHRKRESSLSGSVAKFVLDRLYGFRRIEMPKRGEKRKTQTITSNNEGNKIETEDCYTPLKQPRRDDTGSGGESGDEKEV